jgi:prepilin-type processing-associated H-X9-DG protein
MASYSAKFGSYPPAYAVDRKGRPTVSWRVLLLPYFDDPQASKVYENIRLDEPWDSPHNREATAISEIDRFFQCPTAITPAGETNYAMVVGPDTISDGPHSTRPGNIKDISHTIVVVEVFGAGIHWAKPRDVDFKTMLANGVSGAHKGFAHVLFADGHVQPPATGIDPKTLNAVLTRNGGEEAKEIDKY